VKILRWIKKKAWDIRSKNTKATLLWLGALLVFAVFVRLMPWSFFTIIIIAVLILLWRLAKSFVVEILNGNDE